jgi:hypothetical protein
LAALAIAASAVATPSAASASGRAGPGETATVVESDGHDPSGHADHPDERDADGEQFREMSASGVSSQFFNESGACGPSAGVATPLSTSNASGRSLPAGHQVRGPYGDFYGRNYDDVYGAQVWWTVPMSGGARVRVHERALPAFQRVTSNLNAEAAKGNWYQARLLGSFTWRRIGGSYRMSNHAFGTAIDINWDRNPYSGSLVNELITDMPAWYVKAWTDAGFCWGGDWASIKDPMHFSWMGPAATAGYGTLPAPYPPDTVRSGYDDVVFTGQAAFDAVRGRFTYGFADGNRDAAPDLFRIRPWGADDVVMEFARSSRDFLSCGVTELRVRGLQRPGGRYLLADFDGDARTDLWSVDESGTRVVMRIATHDSGYRDVTRVDTNVPTAPEVEYAAADFDRDGEPDLYVMHRARGEKVRVEVWSGASSFRNKLLDVRTRINGDRAQRLRLGVGDRNADGIPDLYAIRVFASVSLLIIDGAGGYGRAPERLAPAVSADRRGVYGLGDYDGDGRTDLLAVDRSGTVEVVLGGVQTGSSDFWMRPANWTCTDTVTASDPWDYNGDRASDMTIGVPGEDLGSGNDSGVVHVVDGSPSGPAGPAIWYQDLTTVSPAEAGDGFGSTVGWGDFNDDGYADIAVGVPAEDLGPTVDAGLVNVIYGSENGLDPALDDSEDQVWHRDRADVAGTAAAGDRLGATLAAGDFDGDGFDDLAMGSPQRTVAGAAGAGEVIVIRGSKTGLVPAAHQVWSEDSAAVPDMAEAGDGFGSALAAGDFNRDGFEDLAIGVPGESGPGAARSGAVTVLYGGPGGLSAQGAGRFSQDAGSLGTGRATGDEFGAALSAGDFDGDGMIDVAIGAPGDRVGTTAAAGAVHVVFGSAAGLAAAGAQRWHLDVPGINGDAAPGDRFGAALAAGDFNDDGFADLGIGVPEGNAAGKPSAGVVIVLPGERRGPTAEGSQRWHSGKMNGTPQARARLGSSFAVGDFDGDLVQDLLIGSPAHDVGGVIDAGRVGLLYGRFAAGLGRAGAVLWNQGAAVGGTAEAGDGFGALAR